VTDEIRARIAHREDQERTRAELQRLYALLEEAPMLINVLEGPELRIVMTNRRSRALFEGRDRSGSSLRETVPPGNPTLEAVCRVFATGKPETIEVVSKDVKGFEGRSFASTIVAIRDPNGDIGRVMVASTETTEERRSRRALEVQARDLEEARRRAVEASAAKDEVLAMLGHELRNPLAPMFTSLELMRLRGMASREIDVLERQVRHMARLVDDLLDLSRIRRGAVELRPRDVDIVMVVNRALEMTNPLIEQRRHRVIADLAPVAVHGDPDRLAQAVANLINNAAKYSETGSQIRITAQRAGDLAKLSVADDGIGMEAHMLGNVFEPFVQQPQMLARTHGGLGLGLSIVKSLVEAHGGTVTAHSPGLGKGSTFVIELPAISGPSAEPPGTRSAISMGSHTPPRRILVVDDNCDAAFALKEGLEALGHVVEAAHDAPSALATAAAFKPEIALLDIGLPVMDGYELALALRSAHDDIRLVAITGYGQERDRERSREAGFESHLVKPVELERLAQLLHDMSPSRVSA
jgi:signal transduction histidine kinase/ActR/RegA family two-component response regulator